MLKNLPRKYNPPGNGDRDMERPIYANKVEEMILAALGGSGKMTKHGIPSYSWRDDSSSSTNGTQDGNGGSMSASGSVSGTGGGGGNSVGGSGGSGSNYVFRNVPGAKTRTQGNWNTGGEITGLGNIDNGITPFGGMVRPARPAQRPSPVAPIPIPRVKPPVPQVAPFLGPNANVINTLPQIGGTVPSQIQQTINGLNYGPTSFPGTPNGPQVGGVTPGGNSILSQYQDTTGGGKFGSKSTQSFGTTPAASPVNNLREQYSQYRSPPGSKITGVFGGNGEVQPYNSDINLAAKPPEGPFGPRVPRENPVTANAEPGLEDQTYGQFITRWNPNVKTDRLVTAPPNKMQDRAPGGPGLVLDGPITRSNTSSTRARSAGLGLRNLPR